MAQQVSELKANARARSGTGGARATRREDKVPAVVYGDGRAPDVALNGRVLNIVIGGKFLRPCSISTSWARRPASSTRGAARPGRDWLIHVDFSA
jgi:large subunit ribosomal protein L25